MKSNHNQNNSSSKPPSNSSVQVSYQGPIPEASQLAKYEQILPGLADRIVKLTEEKSKHVNLMEKSWLKKSFFQKSLGQIFAFIIVITGMIFGAYVTLHGKLIGGLVIGGFPLVSIAALFITNKEFNKK